MASELSSEEMGKSTLELKKRLFVLRLLEKGPSPCLATTGQREEAQSRKSSRKFAVGRENDMEQFRKGVGFEDRVTRNFTAQQRSVLW